MTAIAFQHHCQDWIDAWNAHDLERILQHYSDDIDFCSPFVTKLTGSADGRIQGKPGLRHYFARGLQAYPDLRFEVIRVYPGVRSCVLEYRSVNQLRAAEMMEFNDHELICRVMAHYTTD